MMPSLAMGLWLLTAASQESMPVTAGAVEGRPAAADASPLQALIDGAAPRSVVRVPAGIYPGDLVIDRPVTLVGDGRPLLLGSGHGSVIRVRAADVVIEGLVIDGRGGGSLADDTSGIHVAAPRVTVRDCEIRNALFGVYLREADGALVERTTITGQAGKPAGEQGSAVHVWNTQGYRLIGNTVRASRDGFYIQSSSGGVITGNVASDLRYGLHFMSAPDNLFEDNRFERSAAGGALMYSHRLTFRRNAFVANRGFASVGLLLQGCNDVVAEANLVANNARGVFLESTARARFSGNVFAQSDVGIVLYASSREVRFEGNTFFGNLTPLELVGRRTDTVFDRNYWADAGEPDLDGDGVRDGEYRLASVFDHFRGNYAAADLFSRGLTVAALAAAERAFPVLRPVPVVDRHPLARRPAAADVPAPSAATGQRHIAGLAVSLVSFLGGVATVVVIGGRPRTRAS